MPPALQDATSGLLAESNFQALLQSFTMIIFSEIGDKTFLIAAILAMRHPRLVVFAGAFGSLVVMSMLSAAMGHLLPTLIPRRWTQVAASILFLVFGVKMMLEAKAMKAGNDKIKEEMKEAQEEIEEDEAEHERDIPLEEMEAGQSPTIRTPSRPPSKEKTSFKEGARNFCSLLLGPVFVQAFVLTFLGEWGDRSQIATIALGAAHVRLHFLHCATLTYPPAERVFGNRWHRGRSRHVHSSCGHRWPVCVYQDLCKTWFVL
jgi:putative Ca2+/H+ antiporter (TMEM165/GDT1 family)